MTGNAYADADLKPAWQPNRNPVNFDHELAAKAVRQCRAEARQLREVRGKHVSLGDKVLEHWTGRHRDEWEPSHIAGRDDEVEHAERLEDLATRIEGWADAAREEEKFRERQIEKWEAEFEENKRNAPRPDELPR